MNKNRFKKLRWDRIIIMSIVFIGLITGLNKSIKSLKFEADEVVVPDKYEEIEVVVKPGDKAWTIQVNLLPENEDVREALYYASEANNQNLGEIKAGQTIKLYRIAD